LVGASDLRRKREHVTLAQEPPEGEHVPLEWTVGAATGLQADENSRIERPLCDGDSVFDGQHGLRGQKTSLARKSLALIATDDAIGPEHRDDYGRMSGALRRYELGARSVVDDPVRFFRKPQ
jgi:hypothetical protein